MKRDEAAEILRGLADGVDPFTGEILPDESPYQKPQVIRALLLALAALDAAPKELRAKHSLPQNAGKTWTKTEDEELAREFDGGTVVSDIARLHKRTDGAIRARLVKIGKITDRFLADSVLAEIRRSGSDNAS